MPDPLNWSEREVGTWDACVYASGLTGVVYGGKKTFALGIYSNAEREALEASDDRPDETGADYATLTVALKRRYGITLRALSTGTIAAAVARPGIGLLLAGRGSPGYQWQPGFASSHSIFLVPKPPGKVLLFDPLAPYKHAGELIDAARIVAWAYGAGVTNAREIRENEWADDPDMTITITKYPSPRTWQTKAGTTTGYRLNPAPLTKSGTFAAGSPAHSDAEVTASPTPTGWPAGPYQRVTDGHFAGYFVANSAITLGPVPVPPAGDCSAQVKAATDPLNAEIGRLKALIRDHNKAGAALLGEGT